MRILTKGADGQDNGWLTPIWNSLDGPSVDQVYLTVIKAGTAKGPHLHMKRRGLFKVIVGTVRLVIRNKRGIYLSTEIDSDSDPVPVMPGTPCALYNQMAWNAYVLNMPSPAWRPDDRDEWPVENWNFSQEKRDEK